MCVSSENTGLCEAPPTKRADKTSRLESPHFSIIFSIATVTPGQRYLPHRGALD
jgi:hypothetical protein